MYETLQFLSENALKNENTWKSSLNFYDNQQQIIQNINIQLNLSELWILSKKLVWKYNSLNEFGNYRLYLLISIFTKRMGYTLNFEKNILICLGNFIIKLHHKAVILNIIINGYSKLD